MARRKKDLSRFKRKLDPTSDPFRRQTRSLTKRLKTRDVNTIATIENDSTKFNNCTGKSQFKQDNYLVYLPEAIETMEQVSRPSDSRPAELVFPEEAETEISDDKENSRPTNHPAELMKSRQHGGSDPAPTLTPSFPPLGTPLDSRSTQDGTSPSKPGDALGNILRSTDVELRQRISQYEQHMVHQAVKLQDLETKLDNQALEHSKVLKQKEEEFRQEHQEKVTRLRKEADDQIAAIKQELANAKSENEKSQTTMSRRIARLTQKKQSLLKKSMKQRQSAGDQIKTLKKKLADAMSQNKNSQAIVSSQVKELADKEEKLSNQSNEYQEQLTKHREEGDAKMAALRSKYEKSLAVMISDIKRLTQKEKSLNAENSELKTSISQMQNAQRQELEDTNECHAQEMNIMKSVMSRAVQLVGERQQYRQDSHDMRKLNSDLRARLEQTEQRLQQTEEDLLRMRMNQAMEMGFQTG